MKIYLIKNIINNKSYIGQTIRPVKARFMQHIKSGRGLIGRAIKKYGMDNFKFEVLYDCLSVEDLNNKEIEFIKKFNTIAPNGYNLQGGGNSYPKSFNHKFKISEALKGIKVSEETKNKQSLLRRGKCWSGNEKPVIGTNLTTGETIHFVSASSAKRSGFIQSHIRECCIGLRGKHRGYTWKYLTQEETGIIKLRLIREME